MHAHPVPQLRACTAPSPERRQPTEQPDTVSGGAQLQWSQGLTSDSVSQALLSFSSGQCQVSAGQRGGASIEALVWGPCVASVLYIDEFLHDDVSYEIRVFVELSLNTCPLHTNEDTSLASSTQGQRPITNNQEESLTNTQARDGSKDRRW